LPLVSNRHAIPVKLVVLAIAALSGAEIAEVAHEVDGCNPFDHFEAQLVFAAKPQGGAMQNAYWFTIHFVGK
jgi:hypothetical protein